MGGSATTLYSVIQCYYTFNLSWEHVKLNGRLRQRHTWWSGQRTVINITGDLLVTDKLPKDGAVESYLRRHHNILLLGVVCCHSINQSWPPVLPHTSFLHRDWRRYVTVICRGHCRPPCSNPASTAWHTLSVKCIEVQELFVLHLGSQACNVSWAEVLTQLVHFLQLQQVYSQRLYCTQHLHTTVKSQSKQLALYSSYSLLLLCLVS